MFRDTQRGFSRLIILIVLAVAILGIAVVYFLKPWGFTLPFLSKTSSPDLGTKIYQQTQNPVSGLPETNPFNKVNPFKGVYKNPFE